MKKLILISMLALSFVLSGCERIPTGSIGLREDFSKQILKTELYPGSFNQVLIGSVITFPIKQIALQLENLQPQTKDQSTLADLDVNVIYNINPTAVGELYTTESHSFHAVNDKGETFLMYNYLMTVANSAAFKAVANVDAMKVSASRSDLEQSIAATMTAALKAEKLDTAITIAQVQIKQVKPAANIIASANAVITAQNNLLAKNVEVSIAAKEAERLNMLSSNHQNIEYIRAMALANIAEGVKSGAVRTIVVPYDFKGLIQVEGK